MLTCGALSLGVRFILRLVLVNTDTFVDSVAALLRDNLALLSGGGLMTETQLEFSTLKPPVNPHLAQLLVHSATNLLVVGDALRLLLLLVLGVPHHAVLRPAGDRLGLRGGLGLIIGSSRHQTHQQGGEGGFQTHLCFFVVTAVAVLCSPLLSSRDIYLVC